MHAVERALEVNGNLAIELLVRGFRDGRELHDACVVHQHVHAAVFLFGRVEETGDRGGIADIRLNCHRAASPSVVKSRPPVKTLADLGSWRWVELSGTQFQEPNRIALRGLQGKKQSLVVSPVLIAEGVTSIREAVLAGLGTAVLPDWLIREDIRDGRLVRLLPGWRASDLPIHVIYAPQRHLPVRVRAFVEFAIYRLRQRLLVEELSSPSEDATRGT